MSKKNTSPEPSNLTQENKDKMEKGVGIAGTIIAIIGGIISLLPTDKK